MFFFARPERVDLAEAAGQQAPAADGDHLPRRQRVARSCEDDHQEVEDRPLFDDHAAVGERLAELEVGIADDGRFGFGAGEAHAHGLRPPVAEGNALALGVDDLQRSLADGPRQIGFQRGIHRVSARPSQSFPCVGRLRRRPATPADDSPDLGLVSTHCRGVRIPRFLRAPRRLRRLRGALRPRPGLSPSAAASSSSASPAPAA